MAGRRQTLIDGGSLLQAPSSAGTLGRADTFSSRRRTLATDSSLSSAISGGSGPAATQGGPSLLRRMTVSQQQQQHHQQQQHQQDASPAHSATDGDSGDGFIVGSRVSSSATGVSGTLAFIGTISGKADVFAGIVVDIPGTGKNDGFVNGVKYFDCPPRSGIFVKASLLDAPAAAASAQAQQPPPLQTTSIAATSPQRTMRPPPQASSHARPGAPPSISSVLSQSSVGARVRPQSASVSQAGVGNASIRGKPGDVRPRPGLPAGAGAARVRPSAPSATAPLRAGAPPNGTAAGGAGGLRRGVSTRTSGGSLAGPGSASSSMSPSMGIGSPISSRASPRTGSGGIGAAPGSRPSSKSPASASSFSGVGSGDRIKQMLRDNEVLQGQIEELKAVVAAGEAARSDLEQELEKLRDQARNDAQQLDERHEQIIKHDATIGQLSARLDRTQSELEKDKRRLEDQVTKLTRQNTQLREELQRSQELMQNKISGDGRALASASDSAAMLESLRIDNAELRRQLDQHRSGAGDCSLPEHSRLEVENVELFEQLEVVSNAFTTQFDTSAQLHQSLVEWANVTNCTLADGLQVAVEMEETTSGGNDYLMKMGSTIEQRLSQLDAIIAALRDHVNTRLTQNTDDYDSLRNEHEQEANRLRVQCAELEQWREQSDEAMRERDAEIESLRTENARLESELKQAQQRIASSPPTSPIALRALSPLGGRAQPTALQETLSQQARTIAELEARLSHTTQERDQLSSSCIKLGEEVSRIEKNLVRLTEELDFSHAENAQLRVEIESLSQPNSLALDVTQLDSKLQALASNPMSPNMAGKRAPGASPLSSAHQPGTDSDVAGGHGGSLGAALTSSSALPNTDLTAMLTNKQRQLDDMKRSHTAEVTELKEHIQEQENYINQLNVQLEEYEQMVEGHIFRENDLEGKVENSNKTIADLSKQIEELRQENLSGQTHIDGIALSPRSARYGSSSSSTAKSPSSGATGSRHLDDVDEVLFTPRKPSIQSHAAVEEDEGPICALCDQPGHDVMSCPQGSSVDAEGAAAGAEHGYYEGGEYADQDYYGDEYDERDPHSYFLQHDDPEDMDNQRAYCEECCVFDDHWTDDCPKLNETF
ncbi:hypothetical protein GQ42DRAFT_159854 [Ramicandelaber brevisporus]|nr:hypothetical protein GQ42DRAFT_159854 [Ramicandelaber brevisporus]